MAVIPLLRVIVFFLVTLSSLAVLGICAHIDYITSGYATISLSFVPYGIAASCLTILSLPVFLALGNLPYRVFTSTILFEIIWLLGLWVLWIGAAGDTVVGKANRFPDGCIYDQYPTANRICYEWTALEAFAFFNFFCAFVYNDVILSYAIINCIRGRSIWTSSVKEAATDACKNADSGIPMVQPQSNAAPATQHQGYGAYPSELNPTKPQDVHVPSLPYNAYPKQVSQGLPPQYCSAYPQQVPPQGPPRQQYNAYPPQDPSRVPPSRQYSAYSPQAPQGLPQRHSAYSPQGPSQAPPSQRYSAYSPHVPPQGQPQQYNAYPQQGSPPGSSRKQSYSSSGSPRKRASYVGHFPSPTSNDFPLPPQPGYNAYPIVCSPPQSPSLSGYQSQPSPQSRSQLSYGVHLPVAI